MEDTKFMSYIICKARSEPCHKCAQSAAFLSNKHVSVNGPNQGNDEFHMIMSSTPHVHLRDGKA
eukprot:1157609-Pelagomonas_calceolata.AAC.2